MEGYLGNNSTVSEKQRPVTRLSEIRKTIAYYFTQPVVQLLARTPITPNIITWFGFLVTLGAAALIITEHLFAAGFVVLIAGFFDILDGALARRTNQTTQFGSVLDSTLDRFAEAALMLSILVLYVNGGFIFGILLAGVALPVTLLVSYIRVKAESLGLECQVGLFTRTERVIMLALGLLLSRINYAFIIALTIIVVFSSITIIQRLFNVWQQTKTSGNS